MEDGNKGLSQDNGAKGRRPTHAEIEAAVLKKTFTLLPSGRCTVCEITLKNGFIFRGKAVTVGNTPHNKEIAEEISYNNARKKIWKLPQLVQERCLAAEASVPQVNSILGYPLRRVALRDEQVSCEEVKAANAMACDLIERAQDALHEGMPYYGLLKDALIHANVMRIALNRIANGSPYPKATAYNALRYEKPPAQQVAPPSTYSMWGSEGSQIPHTTVEGATRPCYANGTPLEDAERCFLVFEAPDVDTAFKFHKRVQDTGSLVVTEIDNVKAVGPVTEESNP
jgi:hypothetical protein